GAEGDEELRANGIALIGHDHAFGHFGVTVGVARGRTEIGVLDPVEGPAELFRLFYWEKQNESFLYR
ncbi:MAG: hypothetical protein D6713_10300, partial [Deltaproteobacteria bacterium]